MTPASPSWADVEKFLGVDGWRQIPAGERGGRRQTHIFFEKLLPDGRLLQTHISHDRSKKISPGRFGTTLLHMSAEIEGLSQEQAVRLVHDHWARTRR